MHFNRQRVFPSLLIGAVFLASAAAGLFIGSRFFSSSRSQKPAEIKLAAFTIPPGRIVAGVVFSLKNTTP